MKKLVSFVFLIIMMVCFCGCSNLQSQENKLIEEGNVKSVSVTSLPESREYLFTGDDAKAVVDYLTNLNLNDDFKENPSEYNGLTWVITLEYENGNTVTVYHSGNMFIRTEIGSWYKMKYREASRFDTLLEELND